MSRFVPTFGVVLFSALATAPLASGAAPPAEQQAQHGGAFARGRIIIIPRAGLSDSAMAGALDEVRGRRGRRLGGSGLQIVEVPDGTEEVAVERLRRHRHMKFAEVDRRVAPDLITNDPYLGSAWHLPKISAPEAWDRAQGSGIIVAILDSGVDGSHPDLAARMVPGWNVYDDNANTSDVYGHGTKVAGAAAASSNNGAGVAGVAGQASIMPIRITDTQGYAYTSTIVQGLTWAADHGARVANISFEAAGLSSVIAAANYMRSKNGLVTVSAGNSGAQSSTLPTTSMIPVSATDSNDARASWSNYGSVVAMSAPGVGIWTTTSGGAYGASSGTSFAAPITAGAIALVMSAKPSLSNTQVENLLYSTATDLGGVGRDIYFGHGRVNANAAVQAAAGPAPTVDKTVPQVAIAAPLGSSTVSGIVSVDATASDNVGVARVELRVNGATIATDTAAPFSFAWDSSKVANGMANLSAVAFDAAGNSASSSTVAVNVANASAPPAADTTKPVVTLVNPTNGSKVSGKVSIKVSAADDSGSSGISQTLYINGKGVAWATGGTLDYVWDASAVAPGTYTIKAWARDAARNSTEAIVVVQVGGAPAPTVDKTAPQVAIAAPLGSSTVSGIVSVNATASDNVGVARVELRVNGATIATDTAAPFSFAWDSSKVANGMANLSAVAFDAAGNSASSFTVTVNVANASAPPAADTTKPVVTLVNPTNGSKVSGKVSIKVSAADDSGSSGISQTLYINGKGVAWATGGTLDYVWDASAVAPGTYTIKAWARDAARNSRETAVTVQKM